MATVKDTKKKQKSAKKWKYHTSFRYILTEDGSEQSLATQLYKVGVYGIANNDPKLQVSYTPGQMVRIKKKLIDAFNKNIISDLEFGRPITVTTDDNGFYIEI